MRDEVSPMACPGLSCLGAESLAGSQSPMILCCSWFRFPQKQALIPIFQCKYLFQRWPQEDIAKRAGERDREGKCVIDCLMVFILSTVAAITPLFGNAILLLFPSRMECFSPYCWTWAALVLSWPVSLALMNSGAFGLKSLVGITCLWPFKGLLEIVT